MFVEVKARVMPLTYFVPRLIPIPCAVEGVKEQFEVEEFREPAEGAEIKRFPEEITLPHACMQPGIQLSKRFQEPFGIIHNPQVVYRMKHLPELPFTFFQRMEVQFFQVVVSECCHPLILMALAEQVTG